MLKQINDLPPHVAGIHAFADVAETEYENTLIPLLNDLLKMNRRIHFVLVLETDIINFSPGKWCGNVKIGLKYFFKWKKVAVVTDQKNAQGFSDLFRYFIPGNYKSYPLDRLHDALKWVSKK